MKLERLVYEESTPWPRWVAAVISISLLIPGFFAWREAISEGPLEASLAAFLLLFVAVTLWLFLGRLSVRVTADGLRLRYGYLPVIQRQISFDQITKMEAVQYAPISEFGGWGVRLGRDGKTAWTIRGNRALCLTLSDGKRLYVGSEHPERLLERARMAQQARARSVRQA